MLLKNATFHADVPAQGLAAPVGQGSGPEEFKSEDVDGMIGMAQAAGYVRQGGRQPDQPTEDGRRPGQAQWPVMDLPNFMYADLTMSPREGP